MNQLEQLLKFDLQAIDHLREIKNKYQLILIELKTRKKNFWEALRSFKGDKVIKDLTRSEIDKIDIEIKECNQDINKIKIKLKEYIESKKYHTLILKGFSFNTRDFREITKSKIYINVSKAGILSCSFNTPKAKYKLVATPNEGKSDIILRAIKQWKKDTNENI